MRIDAHQHFWYYDTQRYSWITNDMKVIRDHFLPQDLKPELVANRMDGCVAVQADQTEDETRFLLKLAEKNEWIKGVVGWVDIKSRQLPDRLDFFSDNINFKGVRHVLQAEPQGFMTSTEFVSGLKSIAKHQLTYDILTTENQLEEVVKLVGLLPEMPLVIDHISKPDIKNDSFDHWSAQMSTLSQYNHIMVKLSGMVTEANWKEWKPSDFRKYIDFCLEKFGPKRLMFGSDWPVCKVAASYSQVLNIVENAITSLSPSEQQDIMGNNARKFYKL